MFKFNDKHNQETMLDSRQWMNSKVVAKLDKSWAPIFYENVFKNIAEEPFAILYDTVGRPNFPVNILLSLEYIKHMKDWTDLDVLDSFYFDYQVNYAVGIRTLGEYNLAERTWNYFRARIYNYSIENPKGCDLLFEQFINLLHVFTGKTGSSLDEQRTDTTLFMSNIKKSGRISLAYDVLVQAVKAIPEENRTNALSESLEPNFKTDILHKTRNQDGDSKLSQLLNLCSEALSTINSDRVNYLREINEIAAMAKEASSLLMEVAADPRCNTRLAKRFLYEVENYLCLAEDYLTLFKMIDLADGCDGEYCDYVIGKIKSYALERKLARLALMTRLEETKEDFLMASHMRNHSIFMQFFADLEGYLANTKAEDVKLDFYDMRYLESEAFKKLR
jgi:hypothetical protein